jgi:hypothetical protein
MTNVVHMTIYMAEGDTGYHQIATGRWDPEYREFELESGLLPEAALRELITDLETTGQASGSKQIQQGNRLYRLNFSIQNIASDIANNA